MSCLGQMPLERAESLHAGVNGRCLVWVRERHSALGLTVMAALTHFSNYLSSLANVAVMERVTFDCNDLADCVGMLQ